MKYLFVENGRHEHGLIYKLPFGASVCNQIEIVTKNLVNDTSSNIRDSSSSSSSSSSRSSSRSSSSSSSSSSSPKNKLSDQHCSVQYKRV